MKKEGKGQKRKGKGRKEEGAGGGRKGGLRPRHYRHMPRAPTFRGAPSYQNDNYEKRKRK